MQINVCLLLNERGDVIRQIPPQYTLDKLYECAAEYVCGQEIPTAFAHQAIMEKLHSQGYKVKWITGEVE